MVNFDVNAKGMNCEISSTCIREVVDYMILFGAKEITIKVKE